MSTTTGGIALPKTVEDWILFLTPLITAAAGFSWGGIVPGASGFLVAAVLASLSKALIGLGQNPHPSNWEDWFLFIFSFLGFLATAFSADPTFMVYGLVIGLIVKSFGGIASLGFSIEDIVLAIGAFMAGIGQLLDKPEIVTVGLLISILGKALPSIGTAGTPTTVNITTTAPASPPTA
jgi:hypothetical protein